MIESKQEGRRTVAEDPASSRPASNIERPASSVERPASKRGGKRPGAGAPKGNLNALKGGRYSLRVRAFRGAMTALPRTTDILTQLTGRDRRKMELLAYGLQFYAEVVLHMARGGDLKDLDNIRVRNRVIAAVPMKDTKKMVSSIEDVFDA